MNAKSFLVSGVVGGIVDFFLGYLFYGILFKDFFSQNESMNLLFIFLGCMSYGMFISYIFNKWAGITIPITGFKSGAVIGLFTSLIMNFFMFANMVVNYQHFALDVVVSIVLSAFVGTSVAFVNGKLK